MNNWWRQHPFWFGFICGELIIGLIVLIALLDIF